MRNPDSHQKNTPSPKTLVLFKTKLSPYGGPLGSCFQKFCISLTVKKPRTKLSPVFKNFVYLLHGLTPAYTLSASIPTNLRGALVIQRYHIHIYRHSTNMIATTNNSAKVIYHIIV